MVNALLAAGDLTRDARMLVTLSPCAMCLGAAGVARLSSVRYLAHDPGSDTLLSGPTYAGRATDISQASEGRRLTPLAEFLPLVRSILRHGAARSATAAAYSQRNPTMLQLAVEVAKARDLKRTLGNTAADAYQFLRDAGVTPTSPA